MGAAVDAPDALLRRTPVRCLLSILLLQPVLGISPALAAVEQRSAQGDCQIEAQRRGYQVLQTSNFRQTGDGWRLDLLVRLRNGRTATGTCFVETRTGRVSLQGFGDGVNGGGGDGDAMRFRCESVDGRYRECQIPVDGTVKRLPRLSDAPCNEGYSWGRRNDRIWVDRGCRSDFEVTPYGWGGGGNPGQQQRAAAACASEARRQYVTVSRMTPANFQLTYWQIVIYGTLRGQPIVGDCRFDPKSSQASLFVKPSAGSGGGGGAQAAARACSDQARRLGYGIKDISAPQGVSGGYRLAMTILRGNDRFAATCNYRSSSGVADIDQVLPQPR